MSDKSLMHGGEESYGGIVSAKQPNKGEQLPAEAAERRPPTEERTLQRNPHRTPSRINGPNELRRARGRTMGETLQPHPSVRQSANIRGRNRVR